MNFYPNPDGLSEPKSLNLTTTEPTYMTGSNPAQSTICSIRDVTLALLGF
jgi:hypothetical protein